MIFHFQRASAIWHFCSLLLIYRMSEAYDFLHYNDILKKWRETLHPPFGRTEPKIIC